MFKGDIFFNVDFNIDDELFCSCSQFSNDSETIKNVIKYGMRRRSPCDTLTNYLSDVTD